MNKYAFDVDGVLLNFYHTALVRLGYPKLINVPDWRCPVIKKHWESIKADTDLWENLPILSDPESIQVPVSYYITALPAEHLERRIKNLKKHGFPEAPVIVAHNKLEACIHYGITHYVDDAPKNVESFIGSDIKIFQFYPHYAAWEKIRGSNIITNIKQFK